MQEVAHQDKEKRTKTGRLLVAYGTTEGHTRLVAERIAETAQTEGMEVRVIEIASAKAHLSDSRWDAIIVGASVHQERHQTSISDFVKLNLPLLNRLPSAFFSVSLSAAVQNPYHQQEAQKYIEAFLDDTGWHPLAHASVAGALRHAEYDYFKRVVLELLAYQLGGGTVVQDDAVYTDWTAVESFCRSFLTRALNHASA
jgi:menaquinone-dependent protoporphyrinogen oxidase